MSVDDGDGGHEFPAHYKVMLGKLNEQRRLDQFTDITLIVDGHQFRAHKAVLAACSQFFYKFFQDFTQEPLVEIEGVSNGAFRHLVEFTYTATLAVSGDEEVNDVCRAAEYLQMQEAIKALKSKSKGVVGPSEVKNDADPPSAVHEAKRRKLLGISDAVAVPTAEAAPLEIQVEVEDEHIEVQECLMEEEVTDGARAETDESALVLLADITSKYRRGAPGAEEAAQEDEAVMATKALGGVELVEVQISENDMFHCDKCERSFKLFYHLKQHMRSHTAGTEKPFVCKQCGKSYAREGALRQHLVYACHYDPNESRKMKRKVHMCVYCNKEFDHLGHFKEHLRKHTGEKPFECPDCHERFARNSTLKCHMSACQNGAGAKKGRKKLYECQVCGEVFNSWDQFKDHLVIHTGEKPNHCTLCDQWFTNSRELGVHLKQEHAVHQDEGEDERVELQVGVVEQQVVLPAGLVVEGHVALQDGVVEQVVMMEGHVELQNGMMEERVVLQDGVILEEGVVISGADEGETVLIQVEEDGAKGQVTEEVQVVTV